MNVNVANFEVYIDKMHFGDLKNKFLFWFVQLHLIAGREQAEMTGARLLDLNYPYTKMISSTMTRARETADIIHKQMPDLPREESDFLREGAPIPPEPPSGSWKPEHYVR